jgi:deoxyribodipyrimidine photolyase
VSAGGSCTIALFTGDLRVHDNLSPAGAKRRGLDYPAPIVDHAGAACELQARRLD